MFYMEDYLTVKTGEEIFGTIGMRPNAKNNVRRCWGVRGWAQVGTPLSTCFGAPAALSQVESATPGETLSQWEAEGLEPGVQGRGPG